MEKRFDMMDFEESLREQVDRFTLIPTKRVWIGLYNNLHPGSKWPSMTMGFLLVLSIIIVGNLNNNSKTTLSKMPESSKFPGNQNQNALIKAQNNKTIASAFTKPLNEINPTNVLLANTDKVDQVKGEKNIGPELDSHSTKFTEITLKNSNLDKTNSSNQFLASDVAKSQETGNVTTADNSARVAKIQLPGLQKNITVDERKNYRINANFIEIPTNKISLNPIQSNLIVEMQVDNNTEENVAATKLVVKKNHKSTWTFYLDPSVSSAWFNGTPISQSSISNASPLLVNSGNITGSRKYHARLSLSAGAISSLPINSKLNFTSGLMLTYLGYKTTSSFIHPTFANLVLKDKTGSPYLKSYMTHFGNSSAYGQLDLNNYSLQFALPIGLQYTLFENQKLSWKIGSSIAPSIVLASQAYIISAEGRNYVTDPELLRRFNLIANFESFVTLKSAKVKWQIGPSFGYQALSTFNKSYTEKEHLLDYGIKIGISR